ncbi:MAG: amidohydrolase family protein [Bilophila sp.]
MGHRLRPAVIVPQRYLHYPDLAPAQHSVRRDPFSGDAIAASGQENIEVNGTGKDLNAKAQYKARITDKETRDFWTYDQRVNTLQALRAVTIMPAWQNKVEDRIGSIEVGKLADFTIMDKDVFEVAETAPRTIADLRVAATIVGDKVVHGMLPDGDVFVSSFRAAYDQPTLDTEVTMIRHSRIHQPCRCRKGLRISE